MTDHHTAILSGWCDGGPLAGQQLAHRSPSKQVSFCRPFKLPKWRDPPPESTEVFTGWYMFDDGAWRWHGPSYEDPSAPVPHGGKCRE